jgi:hypothetical protein
MAQNPNRPALAAQVAFNADPNDPTATALWKEVSRTGNPMLALATKRGRQYELDQNQTGTATVVFDNTNENLSPANTAGVYAPDVLPMRQFRAYAAWPLTGNLLNSANGREPGFVDGYDPQFTANSSLWFVGGATLPTFVRNSTHVRSAGQALDVTWPTASAGVPKVYVRVRRLIPGTRYTFSLYVWVTAGTPNVTLLDTDGTSTVVAAGQTSSSTGTYVRLTYVFDATLDTHRFGITPATGSTAGQHVWIDDYQLEFGSTAGTFTSTGPVLYPLHQGYIERWPARWESAGFRSVTDTTSVDAMAVMENRRLRAELLTAVLDTHPDYYWPLNEPQGSTTFAEASGNNGPPLTARISKYGGALPEAGSTSTLGGDPEGVGVLINPTAPFPDYSGGGLQAGLPGTFTTGVDVGADTGAWQITMAAWFKAVDPPNSPGQRIFAFTGRSQYGYGKTTLGMYLSNTPGVGAQSFEVNAETGTTAFNVNTFLTGIPIWDGKDHLLVAIVDVTAPGVMTVTFGIDDAYFLTSAAIGTTPKMAATWVEVGVPLGQPLTTGNSLVQAQLSHLAVWRRQLTGTERTALWNGGSGYPGELSGTRVARYVAHGYTGPTAIDAGLSPMGVSNLTDGTTVLEAVRSVAVSENGNLFVDGSGTVRYADRASRYLSLTSSFVFGDGPGELPYEDDIAFDFDPGQVFNDIAIDRPGGIAATVADDPSQLTYFPRSLQRTHNVASDLEVADAANWFLQAHKDPQLRVQQIRLIPSANTALWPAALGCEIGTRVTVNRRPKTGAAISLDFFVESVEHAVDQDSWVTTFLLSPAIGTSVWILEDATYGQLDVTTQLAY